ncbi:MAG: SURF1 family protein, partial [Actinomycetota bacterium]|nr:SURF1 family protein [Actinomycetota bacterium]
MPGSRSRRVAVVVVAAVVAATCVGLGLWQLRRLEERRELNAMILDRRSDPSIVIVDASARADLDPFLPAAARGTYDVEHEVLLFGRSLEGEAGHHVVTPLVLPDGGAILVVRGWVPFAMQTAPVRGAAPPAAEVEVSGSLVPDEGDGSTAPDAKGTIRVLDVMGITSTLPYDVFPLPLQLAEQSPPQPRSLPTPVPLPELSEGPHLSYAIQWFAFAAIAVAGGAILLR